MIFMDSRTARLAAAVLLCAATAAPTLARQTGSIAVAVNGDRVDFSGQTPVQQNGRVLVPLRGVLEKIGATVRYSGPTKTVRATRGDTNIALTLGERGATVNGKAVTLDVPAQAIRGTTLVPLRFVAESLGADVHYDGATQMVAIRTDGKPNSIPARGPEEKNPTSSGNNTASTVVGIFVDFSGEDNDSYTLKMTDGRTVTMPKTAKLVYQNQTIGFDDLRSGDSLRITLDPATKRGVSASVSDDE